MRKILFICNLKKDTDSSTSNKIINLLKEKNALIYVDNKELSLKYGLNIATEDNLKKIDLAIVLGGDGTLLKYFRTYAKYQIPTMGVNKGRVGALTNVNIVDCEKCIERYFNNDYTINEQFTLLGTINYSNGKTESFNIYNEASIFRGSSLKLLPINMSINGCQSDEIYADGIIVSTPTGSSAYNLSAGGPLLSNNCGCYVLTPICPQIKNFSSLVVNKNDIINLCISKKRENILVCVDGCDKYPIGINDILTISHSNINIKLIQFYSKESPYQTVYKVIDSLKNKEEI